MIRLSIVGLLLLSCTSASKQEVAIDSVADVESITAIEAEKPDPIQTMDLDTSMLDSEYEKWKSRINRINPTYTVNITTNEYEGSVDMTIVFDTTIAVISIQQSWSAEGMEGAEEYLLKDNTVQCTWYEENNLTRKWCAETGGIEMVFDDETGEVFKMYLDNLYGQSMQLAADRHLSTLNQLLRDAEVVEESETEIQLRLSGENVMEYTSLAEITIPRVVYDALINK